MESAWRNPSASRERRPPPLCRLSPYLGIYTIWFSVTLMYMSVFRISGFMALPRRFLIGCKSCRTPVCGCGARFVGMGRGRLLSGWKDAIHYKFITNAFEILQNPYGCLATSIRPIAIYFQLLRGISHSLRILGSLLKIPRPLRP
jgi:hypothetical protein